jgi:hypothetical protein
MIKTDAAGQLAIIHIPPRQSLDGQCATRRMAYALDRSYRLVAAMRDWEAIDRMLRTGQASVVVVACEEHRTGGLAEEAGMATVADLGRYRDKMATQSIRPATHESTDRLRRILDGDESAPRDVAPETVAALRLIWWRLSR